MEKIMIQKRKKKKIKAPTVVRGIRAEASFFEMCDDVARENGTTRNTLILTAVNEYCKKEILEK